MYVHTLGGGGGVASGQAEVKLGCVRSGWATFQTDDQNTPPPPGRDAKTRDPMPGCGMHSRPRLTEDGIFNSLLKVK